LNFIIFEKHFSRSSNLELSKRNCGDSGAKKAVQKIAITKIIESTIKYWS
jgi:hypothetical protein